jgi:hypothetical protein
MFRVTVECVGLIDDEGRNAVRDILEEFSHRPWHKEVNCEWNGKALTLSATNDYDQSGAALLDEFSDAIHASIRPEGNIRLEVRTISKL